MKALASSDIAVERLPFFVKVVDNEESLCKAVAIRHLAYSRHVPAFGDRLRSPENADYERGSIVLLAESKLDGTPVGSIRVQSNQHGSLSVEQSIDLPDRFKGQSMVEATRLAVTEGRVGRVTKLVLIKALYLYCLELGINWVIATARSPLDKQYDGLLLEDLFEGKQIPMHHVSNLPHRVLALDIPGAYRKWSDAGHPLLDFMCNTHHPDIDISNAYLTYRNEHSLFSTSDFGVIRTQDGAQLGNYV